MVCKLIKGDFLHGNDRGAGFGYGKQFIRPSLSGKIGDLHPRRIRSEPALERQRTDSAQISTQDLKKMLNNHSDWQGALIAAEELGRRVGRLDDLEALGGVAMFCQNEEQRKAAVEKLSPMLAQIQDPRVLEIFVMESKGEGDRRRAIEFLGANINDPTWAFTLVHIALCAKDKGARHAAASKLAGKNEALNVIARNSEYQDTKEYASSLMSTQDGK